MSEAVILVPLDSSEQALAALPVAKVLGEIERAALRIVHVSERRPASAELLKLEATVPDGSTVDARTGEPAAEILLAAGEMKPRLIVMCTHTPPPSRERRSVARRRTCSEMLLVLWCWSPRDAVQSHGIFNMSWCRTMGPPPPARHCDLPRSLPNVLAPNCWWLT